MSRLGLEFIREEEAHTPATAEFGSVFVNCSRDLNGSADSSRSQGLPSSHYYPDPVGMSKVFALTVRRLTYCTAAYDDPWHSSAEFPFVTGMCVDSSRPISWSSRFLSKIASETNAAASPTELASCFAGNVTENPAQLVVCSADWRIRYSESRKAISRNP